MKLSFDLDEHLELQDAPPSLDAYPHQTTTWDKMDRHYLDARKSAGLVVLPTGGGKTVVGAHWLLRNVIARGGRVLWLANRQGLLRQAFKTFRRLGIAPGTASAVDFWRVRAEVFLDTFERYFQWKQPGSGMHM